MTTNRDFQTISKKKINKGKKRKIGFMSCYKNSTPIYMKQNWYNNLFAKLVTQLIKCIFYATKYIAFPCSII